MAIVLEILVAHVGALIERWIPVLLAPWALQFLHKLWLARPAELSLRRWCRAVLVVAVAIVGPWGFLVVNEVYLHARG